MSKEINYLQSTFDKVFGNVEGLAKRHLLTGEALTELRTLLGEHQHAINQVKKTCEEPPQLMKSGITD
jgi:hypothetical protein